MRVAAEAVVGEVQLGLGGHDQEVRLALGDGDADVRLVTVSTTLDMDNPSIHVQFTLDQSSSTLLTDQSSRPSVQLP